MDSRPQTPLTSELDLEWLTSSLPTQSGQSYRQIASISSDSSNEQNSNETFSENLGLLNLYNQDAENENSEFEGLMGIGINQVRRWFSTFEGSIPAEKMERLQDDQTFFQELDSGINIFTAFDIVDDSIFDKHLLHLNESECLKKKFYCRENITIIFERLRKHCNIKMDIHEDDLIDRRNQPRVVVFLFDCALALCAGNQDIMRDGKTHKFSSVGISEEASVQQEEKAKQELVGSTFEQDLNASSYVTPLASKSRKFEEQQQDSLTPELIEAKQKAKDEFEKLSNVDLFRSEIQTEAYYEYCGRRDLTGRTESTNEERSTDWANAESNILNRKIAQIRSIISEIARHTHVTPGDQIEVTSETALEILKEVFTAERNLLAQLL
ncbi:MAG: hypothetical protein EZS28_007509 [Streblomastix strix]|uniref:Uncharacterized protein n=1 Tax=Streblomastix strix TaxID=222440 RepID=A0A5J4WPR3_9EUKA|nr:MAG: hypothetical protein EZS28_007509 [Streblomastix strix]